MQPVIKADFENAIQRGSAFQRERRWSEAETCFRDALRISPGHPDAFNHLGVMAFSMGDLIAARMHFEQGLRADSRSELIFTNLARTLYGMGDWEALKQMLGERMPGDAKNNVLAALWNAAFGKKTGRKIFCIGRNKTGTTSLEQALTKSGYAMGYQPRGEMLVQDWQRRDFSRIARLVETADAFQDFPFSLPETYASMDVYFPGSKFILTIRDDAEQWYQSLTQFHAKIVTQGKRIPTADDLKKHYYRYPGFLWDINQIVYGATEETLYDKALYTRSYTNHNAAVLRHFKDRPGDLLVLNVSHPKAMQSLCEFLSIEWTGQVMPHANKT